MKGLELGLKLLHPGHKQHYISKSYNQAHPIHSSMKHSPILIFTNPSSRTLAYIELLWLLNRSS